MFGAELPEGISLQLADINANTHSNGEKYAPIHSILAGIHNFLHNTPVHCLPSHGNATGDPDRRHRW